MTAPRLFCIPALDAPIVAVLRRGPSSWSHVGRWDTEAGTYEPGAWIKANLYPQRCDLSPDGRWLLYFTMSGPGERAVGPTYLAISRLPWLHALAAWGTCGTWTSGAHFLSDRKVQELGEPDEGDLREPTRGYGLAYNRPMTFAVERRRGWTEAPGTPPRDEHDMWDQHRADKVIMRKPRPGNGDPLDLVVQGRYAAFREGPFNNEPRTTSYSLVSKHQAVLLEAVQWADWTKDGHLLIATTDGKLQVRDQRQVVWQQDLSHLAPNPKPSPPEAGDW